MGLFRKGDRKGKGRSAETTPNGDENNPQKVGVVSGVLVGSEDRDDEGATPFADVVARRFGPEESSADADSASVIETPLRSLPPVHAEAELLESPDLEVDPMGHIGSSTTITGNIVAEEDLEIQGTIEGMVKLAENRATIGEEGVVKGQVSARSVLVIGRVQGDVHATDVVEIKSGGQIGGDVKAPRVIMQDGAIVIGSLDMSAALPKSSAAPSFSQPSFSQTPLDETSSSESIRPTDPMRPTLKSVDPPSPHDVGQEDLV